MFFLIVASIIFLLIINLHTDSAKRKGSFGEKLVAQKLKFLDSSKYKVLNDNLFVLADNRSFQIDHLVISVYGIFVIETKNYKGWIVGNEKNDYWQQILYKKRYSFRNPIKQNWSHIYALKKILKNYRQVKYIPIVVFSEESSLAKVEIFSDDIAVIYRKQINKFIMKNSIRVCLSENDVIKITKLLEQKNIRGIRNKYQHVKNIRTNLLTEKIKKQNLICPRCNGWLQLKDGKYGVFYGCTNYPRCKFTMKY